MSGHSLTTGGVPNSLPPLHQAIPEFHSHTPQERPSSTVPRRLVERGSPSYLSSSNRVSPTPSSTVSEPSTSMPTTLASIWGEAGDSGHDVYSYPVSTVDTRRLSMMSTASSSAYAVDARPNSYLPPVASLTSSRGSSLDMDASERRGSAVTLPSLFNGPPSGHSSSSSGYSHEIDSRGQPMAHDYRYSPGPNSYRPDSPSNQYAQQPYYVGHPPPYAQQHRSSVTYQPRPMADHRTPFSSGAGSVDMGMDQYDQNRSGGKRRRGNLPKQVTDLLRSWLNDHVHHPYPTEEEKQMLMAQTGLTIHQISNWFINARRRRLPAIQNGEGKGLNPMRRASTNQ